MKLRPFFSSTHAPRIHLSRFKDEEKKKTTFFSQLFVVNQFAMPQVVEDGAEVSRVSVDHVGSRLVLSQRENRTDKSLVLTHRQTDWRTTSWLDASFSHLQQWPDVRQQDALCSLEVLLMSARCDALLFCSRSATPRPEFLKARFYLFPNVSRQPVASCFDYSFIPFEASPPQQQSFEAGRKRFVLTALQRSGWRLCYQRCVHRLLPFPPPACLAVMS